MAMKKSKKKRAPARQAVRVRPVAKKRDSFLGSIERIARPKEKEVRVKTFIVERPVYISSDKKFPARGYDSPEKEEPVYDSRKSRYIKKRQQEKELADIDDDSLDDKQGDYDGGANAEFDEQSDVQGDEQVDTDLDQDFDGEVDEENVKKRFSHQRSGLKSLLENWWKRAIVFGLLWWLALLAFAFVMQVFNLVTVDLTRDWWVFLGIVLALSMVYQKFLSGKI